MGAENDSGFKLVVELAGGTLAPAGFAFGADCAFELDDWVWAVLGGFESFVENKAPAHDIRDIAAFVLQFKSGNNWTEIARLDRSDWIFGMLNRMLREYRDPDKFDKMMRSANRHMARWLLRELDNHALSSVPLSGGSTGTNILVNDRVDLMERTQIAATMSTVAFLGALNIMCAGRN